jgi:taurine dioxygenase
MPITVTPSGQACGASITGIDLTQALGDQQIAEIRQAWLEHHVVSFPNQALSDDDLERFSQYFGKFGDDPFIPPIAGRKHVLAIQRSANETSPIFAESWHTDWSFKETPPAATCLFGKIIPPQGGDTLFANQHLALAKMPSELRKKIEGLSALHSAAKAYAPDGLYGDGDKVNDRTMKIIPDASANEVTTHPLISPHPETGEERIFGCIGYIVGIEGMEFADAFALLGELHAWQTSEPFVYAHQWEKDMLIMWDNRSVLHRATGGFEGHARLLHRTTIA